MYTVQQKRARGLLFIVYTGYVSGPSSVVRSHSIVGFNGVGEFAITEL